MTPTVNVIYTRGTVAALGRFAPLLTTHTPWSYRLIANGCPADEVALLHHLADGDSRMSVYDLAAPEVIPHGKVLCLLADVFAAEPYFAFMDSDIVVTEDITTVLTPLLASHAAVFTGSAIWAQPEDMVLTPAHREVCGPHTHTRDGIELGSSYFGVYHRDAYDDVRRRCQVTPDKYPRARLAELDDDFRDFLTAHDLVRDDYTPPKVLTLGFTFTGRTIANVEIRGLHHIGGYSMATYHQQVTDGTAGADPAVTAEILDFADVRTHMDRKIAVCRRVIRSFAAIDASGEPSREPTLPIHIERRLRLIEDLYARQAHHISR